MPDETLITEIENILSQIVALGGENERTAIVPNLIVQDANPTGLDGYVIVSDDRDGDNIPAKKVGSIVYSDNDLVNVMFLKGAEAIAFQQGSQSANSGIWEIVPSTSTDIFYNKGQVGVGTATPGEALDVAGNITLDADIIHRGDTDTKLSLTDDKVSIDAGGLNMLALTETTQDLVEIGDIAGTGDVDINFNDDQMFLEGSTGNLGVGVNPPLEIIHAFVASGFADMLLESGDNAFGGRFNLSTPTGTDATIGLFGTSYVAVTEYTNKLVLQTFGRDIALSAFNTGDEIHMYTGGRTASFRRVTIDGTGRMGLKTSSPAAQLHVDQATTTAAIPVLYLDQADISEEMIEFNTTIGTGNAIEAVGAKTLTTTHFIKVTLPGALTRYIPVGTIA